MWNFSSKDKPATDADSGGYTSEEDKATRARFAIANSRPRDAEARVFFPSRCCANAESATTDRIAHAGIAQVHSERPKINGFAVVEAHGSRLRKSDNSKGNSSRSSLHWKKSAFAIDKKGSSISHGQRQTPPALQSKVGRGSAGKCGL
jgi:hypothetical protein